jgi:hypothetical protein
LFKHIDFSRVAADYLSGARFSITAAGKPIAGNDVCADFIIGVRPPRSREIAAFSWRISIIPAAVLWPTDIGITGTIYAYQPEGACDFPNSENDTLAANMKKHWAFIIAN